MNSSADYAALLLRVSLGVMFLAHSLILKVFTFGLAGTSQWFVSVGLPGWLAYAVCFAEIIGGTMLIMGVYTRWAALALLPILLGAAFVHGPNGWVFSAPNGGWEYPIFLALAAVVQSLLGNGAFSLQRAITTRYEVWPRRLPDIVRR